MRLIIVGLITFRLFAERSVYAATVIANLTINDTDEAIVRTLWTLDQLMTLCVHHSSYQILNYSSLVPQSENFKISNTVEVIANNICLSTLLRNVLERQVVILPTLSYSGKEMHMMQMKFIQPLSFDEFGEFTGFAGLLTDEKNDNFTKTTPGWKVKFMQIKMVCFFRTAPRVGVYHRFINDADPASLSRLRLLIDCFHKQLSAATNACIEVNEPNFWAETIRNFDKNIFKGKHKRTSSTLSSESIELADYHVNFEAETVKTPVRLYLARLSPWRLVIIILPISAEHILSISSSPIIPLLVFHCDEPWMAYHLSMIKAPNPVNYLSDHRLEDHLSILAALNRQLRLPAAEKGSDCLELHWLSTSRMSHNEERRHTAFDLHSYCEMIEEQLYSRAFIATVYHALIEGLYIPDKDLIEAMEEYCEQTNIEVDNIDDCIRSLCSHLVKFHKFDSYGSGEKPSSADFFPNNSEESCEDEQEDYRNAFNELLSRHFRPIPNSPHYFYYVLENRARNERISLDDRLVIPNEESSKELSFDTINGDPVRRLPSENRCSFPLFINFTCSLRFPNMELYTFPVDHLPSCIMQLIHKCPDISNDCFTLLDQIEVSLDIHILSWPVSRAFNDRMDSVLPSPRSNDVSPFIANKTLNAFDFDNISVTSSSIMTELPQLQRNAVIELHEGILRLLKAEKIFVLSRYREMHHETINRVIEYIKSEVKQGGHSDRVKYAKVQIFFVMEQAKALRRLKERLKNAVVEYCKLEIFPDSSNILYCCSISDIQRFKVSSFERSFIVDKEKLYSMNLLNLEVKRKLLKKVDKIKRCNSAPLFELNEGFHLSAKKEIRRASFDYALSGLWFGT
ncbi:unnamed protein product [Dracunculus medinensis]|uniref:Protein SZT2 n=1 Tax=Dracunculus medinensis TaxID=318479 RepID=A0A0N4UAY7_DRAME|nr:unnamed protein product [Dracunculus medinensis]